MNSLELRDQAANRASINFRDNILDYPARAAAQSRIEASGALDLVSQAAGMIRMIQDRALESEKRAKSLTECAIEKLQVAEARIQSAEAARAVVEETHSKLIARLQETERKLKRTQSQLSAAETQLWDAEQRIRPAEARAIDAERTVVQIEDAIRTQLIGLQANVIRESARAA